MITFKTRPATWDAAIGAALIAAGAPLVADAQPAEQVTFATDWSYNGRHAYYFVAQEKGYYADEGLDVEILGGKGSATVIKEVAAQAVDIGFADTGSLVLAVGNEDVPVQEIAIVYQESPHALFVLEESGITEPEDLAGKTLADSAGSSNYVMFAPFAEAAGIDAGASEWVFADSTSLAGMLVNKQVDAIGQYLVGLPIIRTRAAPQEVEAIAYKDYGLDIYSNGIVAHSDTIEDNPEVLKKFVRATMKGLRDACANPQEAGEIMNKHHPQVEAAVATGETELVCEIAITEATTENGLGWIDPTRIEQTIDTIAAPADLEDRPEPESIYEHGFVDESIKPAQ